jgi:predicted amidophosphoribosyltransferase
MSLIYCRNCGAPIEYSGKKPKFCPNCGTPVEVDHESSSLAKEDTGLDSGFTSSEKVPKISKLMYELEYDDSFGKIHQLDELLNEPKEASEKAKKAVKRPRKR